MSRTTSTSRKRKNALRCILCGAELTPASVPGFWLHPFGVGAGDDSCTVRVADSDGVSLDEAYEVGDDGQVYEIASEADGDAPAAREADGDAAPGAVESEAEPGELLLDKQLAASMALIGEGSVDPLMFTGGAAPSTSARRDRSNPTFVVNIDALIENPFCSAEMALAEIFAAAGVPRLGGASGSRGWSSISTFQKCPYLWRRRYIDTERGLLDRTPKMPALEIGTLIHVFVAIGMAGRIDPSYPLTQTFVRDQLIAKMVNPEQVAEAWRVVSGYWVYYQRDKFVPLAVEHLVVDPKTGDSCRLDQIWWLDEAEPGYTPGAYCVDQKSAARFDAATLEGWPNDGEIIGLVDLWDRTKMSKRFGPLQGVIIDILGKQKELQFERRLVKPSKALIKDHRKSLQIWNAAIDTAKAVGSFPRARAACVQRYGYLCDEFDHCVQRED